MIGMLIWACQEPGDVMKTSLYLRGSSLGGSAYSWAFLSGMNSMIGNYGTMAVNINDFARYANRTRSVFVQLIVVPLSFAVIAYIGVLIAGVASDAYGVEVWDPLDIMAYWTGSSGARAGAAFCGLSFTLAQLGANISANCISAANDLNAMFPKVNKQTFSTPRPILSNASPVYQPPARLVHHRLRRCLGTYTMEHPRLCICFAEFHGWVHHLACTDYRDPARRLLGSASSALRCVGNVQARREIPL